MFRKMRRSPQALTHEEIVEVLKKENRGVLCMQGDDGYPYGVPINHYYDEETGKLYFHGANFGYRVECIKRDPKVSYCVFGQDFQKEGDWAKYVKSVVIFGKVELIEDYDEVISWTRKISARFPIPVEDLEAEINNSGHRTLCFALNIEDINGKLVHEA